MALDLSPRDDEIIDNEVGVGIPQSTPMPPGAGAATMPTMTPAGAPPSGGAGAPMDSLITDFLIKKFGGAGVQGANAPPPAPVGPEAPMPMPRPAGAPPPIQPSLTTGSANASAPPPQSAPSAPSAPAGSSWGDIIKTVMAKSPREWLEGGAGARSGAGSANAAPVGPPIPPTAAPSAAPRQVPPTPPTGGNPYSAMMPEWLKNAAANAVKYSVGPGGRGDYNVSALGPTPDIPPAAGAPSSGRGSANAAPGGSTTYPPKDTGATGDEFAARRQGQKIGPPQLESLPKGASTRYTKPYARGGVKEGEKRPQQPKPRASAGRSSSALQTKKASASPRAGAAPQTARGGRSAYAQSLIDSMGPRGQGVTTYIEPATGNEILTGNGMYMNLGKTSTGTSKPAFTKFFS